MEVRHLLDTGRAIWGDDRLTLDQIIVRIGVGVGDLCRQARGSEKDGGLSMVELEKEMGNLIFSAIRWCDDLGLDPVTCIRRAIEAQQRFAEQNTRR